MFRARRACQAGVKCSLSPEMPQIPAMPVTLWLRLPARWGVIDLLVNNAGSNFHHELLDTTFEEYLKSFEINCLSSINCTQARAPEMLKNGRGSIVNISSIYGRWASSNSASYSVGKYAVAGYTDALRQGLIGTPLHVMGVFPGFIRTDMTMPFVVPGSLRSRMGKTPDQMAKVISRALNRKKPELYYPWYVPWVLRLHRWFPKTWPIGSRGA